MSSIDFLFNQLDFCVFCLQQRDAVGESDHSKELRKVQKRRILTEMTNDDKNDKMSLLADKE